VVDIIAGFEKVELVVEEIEAILKKKK